MKSLRDVILAQSNNQKKLPNIEFSKATVFIKPPYRNPSPHTISVLTMLCDLGAIIDINTRAFTYGVANEMYRGNYTNEIVQIQYLTESFKVCELKETLDLTFGNQCTMIVKCGKNTIYVKLFNTGTLHFTGLTSIDDAKYCTDMIINRIKLQYRKSLVNEQIHDLSFSPTIRSYSSSSSSSSSEITTITPILKNIELIWSLIKHVPMKDIYQLNITCKKFNHIIQNEEFWKYCIKKEFNQEVHPVKTTYKYIYFKLRSSRLPNYKPIIRISCSNINLSMKNVSIEMINSNFTVNFCINQRKFTKILQKKFPLFNTSFEPDDKYHGIKVYWPILGTDVKIFISIFRTGSIIMSGAKEYSQLTDAYKFINNIIKTYYDEIWIPDDVNKKK